MIDNQIVDPFRTLDNTAQKILLNSEMFDNDGYRHDHIRKTNCSWVYGVFDENTKYELTLNKFVVPGCNDCEC